MPTDVKAYTTYDRSHLFVISPVLAFQSIQSLLSEAQLARLSSRPVMRLELSSASGNFDVATTAVPGGDTISLGTNSPPEIFLSTHAIQEVYVSAPTGNPTIGVKIYTT